MDSINSITSPPLASSNPVRPSSVSPLQGEASLSSADVIPFGVPRDRVVQAAKGDGVNGDTHSDHRQVADAVKNINDFLQVVQRTLQFTLDEDSGRMVVQIKDANTKEVIRQIPPENMLKLAEQMDKLKGLLFEEIA